MIQDGMRDLTMQMQKKDGGAIPLQLRQAKVTAVTGDTLTVTLDGTSITGVRKLASYAPTVNDTVWLFQNGGDLLAIDRTGASAYAAATHAHDTIAAARRAESLLMVTNTDVMKWNGSRLYWPDRLIALGAGRGTHWSTHGWFGFTIPAVGTTIPGYGGAPSTAVDAAGVSIPVHTALYGVPTIGGTSGQTSLALVGYTSSFVVPEHWVLIASTSESGGTLQLSTGQLLDPPRRVSWLNGWNDYGGTYVLPNYRKDGDGLVHLSGLCGGAPTGDIMFNLPAGYRPAGQILTSGMSSSGQVRIDIDANGNVRTTHRGWITLDNIAPFRAEA